MVQEDGWASGPVWTGAENLASTGIRFSHRPSRRQALYRLSYPGQTGLVNCLIVPSTKVFHSNTTGRQGNKVVDSLAIRGGPHFDNRCSKPTLFMFKYGKFTRRNQFGIDSSTYVLHMGKQFAFLSIFLVR